MDYEKSSVNKPLIQDKIRDGTSSWDDVNTSNFDFYQVHGKILKSVKLKKDVHTRPHYDLRTHRAAYSTKVASSAEISRKSIFWFKTLHFLLRLVLQSYLISDLPTSLDLMEMRSIRVCLIHSQRIPTSTRFANATRKSL